MELPKPAIVHWSFDHWDTIHDTETRDSGLGLHLVDLSTDKLTAGAAVCFTIRWSYDDSWEGEDYYVQII